MHAVTTQTISQCGAPRCNARHVTSPLMRTRREPDTRGQLSSTGRGITDGPKRRFDTVESYAAHSCARAAKTSKAHAYVRINHTD